MSTFAGRLIGSIATVFVDAHALQLLSAIVSKALPEKRPCVAQA